MLSNAEPGHCLLGDLKWAHADRSARRRYWPECEGERDIVAVAISPNPQAAQALRTATPDRTQAIVLHLNP